MEHDSEREGGGTGSREGGIEGDPKSPLTNNKEERGREASRTPNTTSKQDVFKTKETRQSVLV